MKLRFTLINSLFFSLVLLYSSGSYANSQVIFDLYRNNYYTHKTLQYRAHYTNTCQFRRNNNFSFYFISTESRVELPGETREGRITRNHLKYYGLEQIDLSSDRKVAKVTMGGIDFVADKIGASLSIFVRLEGDNKQNCKAYVGFYKNDQLLDENLSQLEMSFNLTEYSTLGISAGKHPSKNNPFSWVQVIGEKRSCIYGHCR